MKLKFIGIFLLTFFIGYVFLARFVSVPPKKTSAQTEPVKVELIKPELMTKPTELTEPKIDYVEEETPAYKIDLLITGAFHGDEVAAKSGEIWLGLFNEKGKSYLAFTKLKVSLVRDEVLDNQTKEFTGKKVSVKNRAELIFLLKKASMLKPGEVSTVHFPKAGEASGEPLKTGFTQNYNIGKSVFTIKYNDYSYSKVEDSGGVRDVFAHELILSGNGKEQLLSSPNDRAYSYNLLWAGDLDRDGKLDLYIETSGENFTAYGLYLSSEAEEGKLVKEVAGFGSTGC